MKNLIKQESILNQLHNKKEISHQLLKKGMKIRKFHQKMTKKLGLYAPTKDSLMKLENYQSSLYPLHLIGQYGRDDNEAKWRDLMDFFQKIQINEKGISVLIDTILDRSSSMIHPPILPNSTTIKHIICIGYDLIKNKQN